MTAADLPDSPKTPKKPKWGFARILLWVFGIPAIILLAIYVKLLFGPIPLPFAKGQAEAAAAAGMPENFEIELGEAALALEGGLFPVVQFSPVKLSDNESGATIEMAALHVGFSPLSAVFGNPSASITLVQPQIQMVQDLFGPRLASFELVDDQDGNDATIWVLEGDTSFPSVKISAEGLDVAGAIPDNADIQFRSDNDWLIYNFKASEEGIAAFAAQVDKGQFSRFRVRDGTLGMHDTVFGIFRQFSGIQFDIAPNAAGDAITGKFAAELAGRKIGGTVTRSKADNGDTSLRMLVDNLDFASLLPFIDDPDGVMAVRGTGKLDVDVRFDPNSGEVLGGLFDIDLTGARLRILEDQFPIATENARIVWIPSLSQFSVENAKLTIGQSSGELSGVFVMGLDETYGPTLGISVEGTNVVVHPYDMAAPAIPFSQMAFSGWAAPLYGAIGIDQLVVQKPGVLLRTKGRVDMLRAGIGIDLEIGGEGASADDLKRLWPYFISSPGRDWFVKNVTSGHVDSTEMRLNFPVGTISIDGTDRPVPKGALSIDLTGSDVAFMPTDKMAPIAIEGKARIRVRDDITTIGMDGATVNTEDGAIALTEAAFIIDGTPVGSSVFEISGDISGKLPSLLSFAESQAPDALGSIDLPMDPDTLSGDLTGTLVATIIVGEGEAIESIDYAANGTISNFSSGEPVSGHLIDNGQIGFSVNQGGYNFNGTADVGGFTADLSLSGELDGEPEIFLAADVNVEKMKELGFDASEFLSGDVRFVAKPDADGTLQIAADLTEASLNVADLGISKAKGVEGTLNATVLQSDEKFNISDVVLAFAEVSIKGDVVVDSTEGFESADFTTFALSKGDNATLTVQPTDNGIAVTLRGERLDLKPMLHRAFALDQSSAGGPQSTQFNQTLILDIELEQAIGFYRTIAYNFDLDMELHGEDLRRVSLQTQFTEGSGVSITTNPVQGGRTMSVAFNDAGTLLRFLNVYPRLLGGQGAITMTKDTASNVDRGVFDLRNFSLVDEEKVTEVLGNHKDSQSLVANENRIKFNYGQVQFVRRSDRIEVVEALLDGDSVGGTARGFIYTKKREYDLAGTYIPLFGLNSIFQKLPILGPLLGGRDGEGLVGVTFAIRGDLDQPNFLINPASILLPGVFRSLMEFRATEAPREKE